MRARSTLDWSQSKIFFVCIVFLMVLSCQFKFCRYCMLLESCILSAIYNMVFNTMLSYHVIIWNIYHAPIM